MTERDIKFEGTRFWVGADKKAYTVYKIGSVASESVQSFAKTADGLSLAIAYAKYKDSAAQTKYEDEMNKWRMESPDKFLIRICQYLHRYYPDALYIIEGMVS